MDRPFVVLNSAMTVDGKISSVEGDSGISCRLDLDRVHNLRAGMDAIMVGIGTVLSDDPELTVRRSAGENPLRIVVDSKGRMPSDANVLDDSASTLVAVSQRAEESKIQKLRSKGVEVFVAGEKKVDLESLLEQLYGNGVDDVLLEGGSELNWGMLSKGLVDEVRVVIRPCIVGGREAKTLVGGLGVESISNGISLELLRTEHVGRDLLLYYKVRDKDD